MNLIQTCKFLAEAKIGPREGIALGIVIAMKGKAQTRDVREAIGTLSKDGRSVLYVLRKKGLVELIENPAGYPFWRVTPSGLSSLGLAKSKATGKEATR